MFAFIFFMVFNLDKGKGPTFFTICTFDFCSLVYFLELLLGKTVFELVAWLLAVRTISASFEPLFYALLTKYCTFA